MSAFADFVGASNARKKALLLKFDIVIALAGR
jgi:hypothetical protein